MHVGLMLQTVHLLVPEVHVQPFHVIKGPAVCAGVMGRLCVQGFVQHPVGIAHVHVNRAQYVAAIGTWPIWVRLEPS